VEIDDVIFYTWSESIGLAIIEIDSKVTLVIIYISNN
jgi:hypothetical protein